MNLIRQYEFGLLSYVEFSEELWGYGQLLINEVSEECFSFYINAAENEYYIYPYKRKHTNSIRNSHTIPIEKHCTSSL